MDELTIIMRSLGMSPTITELKTYMREKGGKLAFADFLEIMHTHSKKESIPRELLEAFRGMDPSKKGTIPAKDLWHILVKWGEKLSPREGNKVFFRGAIKALFTNFWHNRSAVLPSLDIRWSIGSDVVATTPVIVCFLSHFFCF